MSWFNHYREGWARACLCAPALVVHVSEEFLHLGGPAHATCTSTRKQQLTAPRQASSLPAVRRGFLLEKKLNPE